MRRSASRRWVVFLDWDRTFCTTKSGAAPVRGRHAADEALLALARSHPRVVVVTRNSHVAEIEHFLASPPGHALSHSDIQTPTAPLGHALTQYVLLDVFLICFQGEIAAPSFEVLLKFNFRTRKCVGASQVGEGLPDVAVRSVKAEGVEKHDVILDPALLPPGKVGVFADDDTRELFDPTISAAVAEGRLHRVLFCRG